MESPDLGNRRLYANLGFQINYNLPQFLFNITSPATWPGLDTVFHPSLNNQGRRRRDIGADLNEIENEQDEQTNVMDYSKYSDAKDIIKDLSAGVFYKAVRAMIEM